MSKKVYIQNIGHIVIPERNTEEDIINIVKSLNYNVELISDFLEVIPESNTA